MLRFLGLLRSFSGKERAMSVETVLVVTPEVAKSLRRHGYEVAAFAQPILPRGSVEHLSREPSQRQASQIEGVVGKWGGVLIPMHERAEGDLSTYFVVEQISPSAAEALVSEIRRSPGVLSSYIKPAAVLAGGFEPGPYVTFD
jgi:hypothetical protein